MIPRRRLRSNSRCLTEAGATSEPKERIDRQFSVYSKFSGCGRRPKLTSVYLLDPIEKLLRLYWQIGPTVMQAAP